MTNGGEAEEHVLQALRSSRLDTQPCQSTVKIDCETNIFDEWGETIYSCCDFHESSSSNVFIKVKPPAFDKVHVQLL